MTGCIGEIEKLIREISTNGTALLALPLQTDHTMAGWQEGSIMLSKDDLPTLERALAAAESHELAWLGWKIVTDPQTCMQGDRNGRYPTGCADNQPCVFFANDARKIVTAHGYSERDRFQMLDITRGPAMHYDQFPGVLWGSVALQAPTRLVLFGASQVALYTARYASDAGFKVEVVDDDAGFLTSERFPNAVRTVCGFDDLSGVVLEPGDFACILTRNHAHDEDALMHVLSKSPAYVGLIGHVDKIASNLNKLAQAGIDTHKLEQVHAPIGIKCGARTPAEIATSITAELIQERAHMRKGERRA